MPHVKRLFAGEIVRTKLCGWVKRTSTNANPTTLLVANKPCWVALPSVDGNFTNRHLVGRHVENCQPMLICGQPLGVFAPQSFKAVVTRQYRVNALATVFKNGSIGFTQGGLDFIRLTA